MLKKKLKLQRKHRYRLIITKQTDDEYHVLVSDIGFANMLQKKMHKKPFATYIMTQFAYRKMFGFSFVDISSRTEPKSKYKARAFLISDKKMQILKNILLSYGEEVLAIEKE